MFYSMPLTDDTMKCSILTEFSAIRLLLATPTFRIEIVYGDLYRVSVS